MLKKFVNISLFIIHEACLFMISEVSEHKTLSCPWQVLKFGK